MIVIWNVDIVADLTNNQSFALATVVNKYIIWVWRIGVWMIIEIKLIFYYVFLTGMINKIFEFDKVRLR